MEYTKREQELRDLGKKSLKWDIQFHLKLICSIFILLPFAAIAWFSYFFLHKAPLVVCASIHGTLKPLDWSISYIFLFTSILMLSLMLLLVLFVNVSWRERKGFFRIIDKLEKELASKDA